MKLPAHAGESLYVKRISPHRRGFFEQLAAEESSYSLRSAIIEPADESLPIHRSDSSRYPWDFLVSLAREAASSGARLVRQMADCRARQDRFDWTVSDQQIRRVLGLNGEVEVLLPFRRPHGHQRAGRRSDEGCRRE